jgi:hypothetical protein
MIAVLSALSLIAVQAPAPALTDTPASSAPVSEEIVVMGKALRNWKGQVRKRGDAFTCRITQSSGDAELDDIRCNAHRWCAQRVDGDIQALGQLKLEKAALNARINALAQRIGPCVTQYETLSLEHLARERAGE